MNNLNVPIPGHENDKIIMASRKHFVSILGSVFIIFLMLVLPIGIVVFTLSRNPTLLSGNLANFATIILSIYYLVVVTFAFNVWVTYYYDIFVLTDKELIDIVQNGIFDRRISEVSLLRIQDVQARIRGFWPTIFGYGDVIAESAGENSRTYVIDSVPNPIEIANKVLELHNEHIAREERAAEIITAEGDLRAHQLRPTISDSAQSASIDDPTLPFAEPPCPPCPPQNNQPPSNSNSPSQGEVQKDDLDKGGQVQL